MSDARSVRRMAWVSYGAGIGLALGTVVGLAVESELAVAAGAAVGAVAGGPASCGGDRDLESFRGTP